MKIELQISELQGGKADCPKPQETDKIQKVIEFAENLDQKKQSKERLMIRSISLRLVRYSASISRIGRFLQKRLARPYNIDLDSIGFLKFCQPILSKFPNQKSSISTPSLISS